MGELKELRKVVQHLDELMATTPPYVFTSAASSVDLSTLKIRRIVVQEDTVIASLTVDGAAASALGTADTVVAYNYDGATLKAGLVIAVPNGSFITELELTSGSVACYAAEPYVENEA